jgi:hypothetical protein
MIESILQTVVGLVVVAVAVYQIGRGAVAKYVSAGSRKAAPPDEDVRIVSDLAARLRGQGKSQAVQIALQLCAELLKPEEPKP